MEASDLISRVDAVREALRLYRDARENARDFREAEDDFATLAFESQMEAFRWMVMVLMALPGKDNPEPEPVEALPKWVRPEMALPAEDTPVLVIASGRPVHETTLDHAVLLAKWYPVEGWILEEYPSYEKPKIHFWAPIPELPEEARV